MAKVSCPTIPKPLCALIFTGFSACSFCRSGREHPQNLSPQTFRHQQLCNAQNPASVKLKARNPQNLKPAKLKHKQYSRFQVACPMSINGKIKPTNQNRLHHWVRRFDWSVWLPIVHSWDKQHETDCTFYRRLRRNLCNVTK